MGHGQRLNIKYLRLDRCKKPKRCSMCDKAIRRFNKKELCNNCYLQTRRRKNNAKKN